MQTQHQSSPDVISATAEEIAQLGEELRATIAEADNAKVILHRYTIAEELRRIADLVAGYGDDAV